MLTTVVLFGDKLKPFGQHWYRRTVKLRLMHHKIIISRAVRESDRIDCIHLIKVRLGSPIQWLQIKHVEECTGSIGLFLIAKLVLALSQSCLLTIKCIDVPQISANYLRRKFECKVRLIHLWASFFKVIELHQKPFHAFGSGQRKIE